VKMRLCLCYHVRFVPSVGILLVVIENVFDGVVVRDVTGLQCQLEWRKCWKANGKTKYIYAVVTSPTVMVRLFIIEELFMKSSSMN